MAGLFNTDLAELQAKIRGENVAERNAFLQGAAPSSLFAPVVQGAYGLIQQTRDTLSPDPRMQKAQALEAIKQEASKTTQPGTVEHYKKLAELSQEKGFADAAEYASLKSQELEIKLSDSTLKQQKTLLDIQKTYQELTKPREDKDLDPIANSRFGKNFFALTQEQQQVVIEEDRTVSLNKAKASATQVINAAQEKGLGEFGKIAGKQIFDSATAVNQLEGTIKNLENVKATFATKDLIAGGGTVLQAGTQIAFEVLDGLNILTPEERTRLKDTQSIEAALNNTTLDALGGSLGAQISDGDRAFIAKAFGRLAQQPEAVVDIYDRIIGIKKRELERQRKLGKASIQAVQEGDPSIFYDMFEQKPSETSEGMTPQQKAREALKKRQAAKGVGG